jgi:predicted AlkP superfamily phosphohydrolase/phosphomutase
MNRRRILLLGLDGFDIALAERFVGQGLLPNFARLRSEGCSFDLDHGRDKYSGLAWEHFSSGVRPSDGGRWSAITFDRHTYGASQDYGRARPYLANLAAKAVVFDFPYFELSLAQNVRGITTWGAHDPGVLAASRPAGLHQEVADLFGEYPAPEWIYGFCWPSAQKARAAGEALTRAVEVRSRASNWLLKERLPDWDLGVVVVGECHSAIEPLWHGVDENHPLYGLESAPCAAAGLRNVYTAIDNLIGDLQRSFSDAILILVAMHGMGPNDGDVPAMALLPELMYRFAFGAPYMRQVQLHELPDGTPLLAEDAQWEEFLLTAVPRLRARFDQRAMRRLKRILTGNRETGAGLDWMPAYRYCSFWPKMPAFALPSYYDGRIRLNVVGREKRGLVSAAEYGNFCRQISELISECRNLLKGTRVASEIYWPKQNPNEVGPSEADIYIVWEGAPLGFSHPKFGCIGPMPYRRTGGHTGHRGFLTVIGSELAAGTHGFASSFDVVPTIIDLLGEPRPSRISGRSLLPQFAPAPT